MKCAICQGIVSVSTFFVMVFLAMGVQADEKDCIDVSGTWDATQKWDASNCGGAIRTERYTYELIQNGCTVIVKRKEGQSVHLWDLITREVVQPIGINHLPILHTIESDGAPGIPKLEGGMIPNLDDLAKLAKLLRNGGRYQGEQILSATKLEEAFGKDRPPGLPTGWLFDDGEVNYHMSLWQHPYRAQNGCFVRIPAMSGHGGTYVVLCPIISPHFDLPTVLLTTRQRMTVRV